MPSDVAQRYYCYPCRREFTVPPNGIAVCPEPSMGWQHRPIEYRGPAESGTDPRPLPSEGPRKVK